MNTLREVQGIRNSALVKKYKNIFICVNKWGAFGQSDIDRNKIHRCKTVPGFVTLNKSWIRNRAWPLMCVISFLDYFFLC